MHKKAALVSLAAILLLSGCGGKALSNEIPASEDTAIPTSADALTTDGFTEDQLSYMREVYLQGVSTELRTELDLDFFEDALADESFVPCSVETRTDEQKAGDLGLRYFFLANEINLNVLNGADLQILSEAKDGLQADVLDVVYRTLPEVIIPEGALPTDLTYYGENVLMGGPQMVSANSLVLKIVAQHSYDENGNPTESDGGAAAEEKMDAFVKEINEQLEGLLGDTPVVVSADFMA